MLDAPCAMTMILDSHCTVSAVRWLNDRMTLTYLNRDLKDLKELPN